MIYDPAKKLLIAGPCTLESESVCRVAAETLVGIKKAYGEAITVIYSGSFDKANRTSIRSERGPGLEKGLELLKMIGDEYGLPLSTDLHAPEQAERVGEVCDVLQIPAFLCRQTDLLVESAKTGRVVNVKKGQFSAPEDMKHVVQKLEDSDAREIWLTERGTSFGYHNLVVDFRSFPIMAQFGHPVIFDATHAVQLPAAADGQSSAQREFVLPLTKAALATGHVQGLYIETHPNPDAAVSDAKSQIPTAEFEAYLGEARFLPVFAPVA